jgi:Protein of unknown function (DUF1553)/Protein of unknown function (DUF1549)/Planctomycete cytochrome C
MCVHYEWTATLFVMLIAAELQATPIDFARDVRPILERHCYSCHGADQQKSGLRLDIKSEAFKGGDGYGPSIIAGRPDESPLIQFISQEDADLQMPPKDERLSEEDVAVLIQWVHEGAHWPDGIDLAKQVDLHDHWSFHRVQNHPRPRPRNEAWTRNEIDCFILDKLETEGLQPAPEATRSTWLRRVALDLTGLPPTPEQVEAFIQDPRVDAHARVVDQLLSSPRYGERWAQHWLDVVRYADTDGFEVNTERPHAWPYRDYVIQAFNQDLPYDQFVREQIAGDAFGNDAATGFLITASVLLPGQIGADDASKRLARQDALDEIVVNITQTFLGLSVGCARCHDHKFEPIRAQDYYGMQAFVAGVEYADRELRTPEAVARRQEAESLKARLVQLERLLEEFEPRARPGSPTADQYSNASTKSIPLRPAVNAKKNSDRFPPRTTKRMRLTIRETNSLEPCIDELEVFDTNRKNIAREDAGTKVISSGDTIVPNTHELRFIHDGKYGNSHSWMSNEPGKGWVILEFPTEYTIERVVWGRDREQSYKDRLATNYTIEVADLSGEWQTVADSTDRHPYVNTEGGPDADDFSAVGLSPDDAQQVKNYLNEFRVVNSRIATFKDANLAYAGIFRTPDPIYLLRRGDPEQAQEEVEPTLLPVLSQVRLSKETPEQQRRVALAQWIADPENPLTARIMVNRIWQGHFGTGIVETASDFGHTGAMPSHPELLDWLAKEFVESGWSLKHMHRLMVLSATYRQSTRYDPKASLVDAESRWLWRYPIRRLDAETIRDSMIAVSGQLDPSTGGPGFDLFDKRGGLTGFEPIESFTKGGLRRMIYAHRVRREREAVFGAFDCPDAGQSTSRRRESTTPIQALNLFNSRFTLDQARAFANRVHADVGDNLHQQIRRAYQLALSRDPEPDEFVYAEPIVHDQGLATLARALFNSNEFLFLP